MRGIDAANRHVAKTSPQVIDRMREASLTLSGAVCV
jgi:hypothetical protein